jgi:cobalt/nickel transport system permease protein
VFSEKVAAIAQCEKPKWEYEELLAKYYCRAAWTMHIPDGFLSLIICVVLWIVALAFLVVAFWRANRTLDEKRVPLMATLTAMFFAAQMMNYPIIGGTTAHLLGAPVLAITLGPFAGLIAMTIILTIQALFFGDGGILSFGANVFNMGIIATFIPFAVFAAVWKISPKRQGMIVGGFLGSFLGDLCAAIAAGLELGFSSTFPYGPVIAVAAMAVHHSIIGVIEGVATVTILLVLLRVRPDLLPVQPLATLASGKLPAPAKEGPQL